MRLFLLFLAIAISTRHSQAGSKPNILVLAIDDMNDWTGFLGGHPEALTPNMDRLAKQGVNFTNAHCSAPGCSPSRNSILFGKEPFNSGLYAFYEHNLHAELIRKYVSLPQLLKANEAPLVKKYITAVQGTMSADKPNKKTEPEIPKKSKKKQEKDKTKQQLRAVSSGTAVP